MPRALGHGLESPGKAGRHRGPSGQVPSLPGQLVDTSGPREKAQVSRDSWSIPRGLGYSPELPGRAGQNREPSTLTEWLGTAGRPHSPSDTSMSHPGQLVDPAGYQTWARVAWKAGRHRGPSDQVPSHPEQLVDPAGLRALARVTQNCRSTSQALRREPESSWMAGRTRGPSDTSARRPGKLFHTAGPRAQSTVTRDSWSTP